MKIHINPKEARYVVTVCFLLFLASGPGLVHFHYFFTLPCVTWLSVAIMVGFLVLYPLAFLHGVFIWLGIGGLPVAALC